MKLDNATYEELMMQLALNGFTDVEVIYASASKYADDGSCKSTLFLNNADRSKRPKTLLKHIYKAAKSTTGSSRASVSTMLRTFFSEQPYDVFKIIADWPDEVRLPHPAVSATLVLRRR